MTSGDPSEREQRPPEHVGPLLRNARTSAGLSQPQVERATSLSQNGLSRIERGEGMPRIDPERGVDQVAEMAALYGLAADVATELTEVVTDFWEARKDERIVVTRATNVLSVQRRIRRREEKTKRLRSFTNGLPFGWAQTPEVMAAIFGVDVDHPKVRDRMRRAAQLPANADRQYEGVMTEGGLRWVMGSAEVMAAQVEHLAAVAALPNVDLRLITARTPVGMEPGPGFHIHDEDGPVVLAQVGGSAELDKPEQVARYIERFDRLQAVALTGDDVLVILTELAEYYRGIA